jgi:hypothetical protein
LVTTADVAFARSSARLKLLISEKPQPRRGKMFREVVMQLIELWTGVAIMAKQLRIWTFGPILVLPLLLVTGTTDPTMARDVGGSGGNSPLSCAYRAVCIQNCGGGRLCTESCNQQYPLCHGSSRVNAPTRNVPVHGGGVVRPPKGNNPVGVGGVKVPNSGVMKTGGGNQPVTIERDNTEHSGGGGKK